MGPTKSSDYPILMGIISLLVTLGFLGAIFPVVELVFNVLIPFVVISSVLYLGGRWIYDEYQLNKEIHQELTQPMKEVTK